MATRPKSKSTTSTSVAILKAWLSGVEEMQGEEWTPSAEQWRKIRDKIMALEEVPPAPPAPEYPQPAAPRQFMAAPSYAPAQSAFEGSTRMPAPMQQQPFGQQPSVKTPDIDSTNGYQSDLI